MATTDVKLVKGSGAMRVERSGNHPDRVEITARLDQEPDYDWRALWKKHVESQQGDEPRIELVEAETEDEPTVLRITAFPDLVTEVVMKAEEAIRTINGLRTGLAQEQQIEQQRQAAEDAEWATTLREVQQRLDRL
jgi:hypothetical protein